MNGPPAPLRGPRPPRRAPVSVLVPATSKKQSSATCPSAKSTPMPSLHPQHLVSDVDAPPTVSDASAEFLQQATPICPKLAMATGIGPWTHMMYDETDVDAISLSMPPDDLCTQTKAAKAKRAGNYTHDEDIQLCVSWENITIDPIVANEQPGRAYWQRIANHYHTHKTFESDRNANSLEHRWSTIQRDCLKFQGFYDDVERRHPSGIPYKEHILEAQAMFAKPPQKKAFKFLHCWTKVRHCQKFQSIETNKRPWGSRSSTPSEGATDEEYGDESGRSETPDSTQSTHNKRPMGRKQAKDRLKTGGDAGPYKEAIEELIKDKKEEKKLREEEKKQEERLMEEKKQKEERWKEEKKLKEERWNESRMIQQQKITLEKEKFMWEKEQKIMFCDLSTLDPNQKTYVLAMRAQLVAQKLAAINGGFGGGFDGGFDASSGGSGGDVGGGAL